MSFTFSRADVAFLTSSAGREALAFSATLELSSFSAMAAVRNRCGEWAGAVLETARLRSKANGRVADPGHWLFTEDALQQATASPVAEHRARRLSGRFVHDATCSIGTEVAQFPGRAIGSDLDPVRLAMARHNVPDGVFVQADALAPISRDAVVLVDPGRRRDGKRVFDPNALSPPLGAVREVHADRDIVIKCAPGLDYESLDWAGEVEVVSLDGGVREACLWSAGIATARRRATILPAGETLTDADPDDVPERQPGEWIVNPDGAIVRAGLVRHYAARHGLWQLDPRIAYLTGSRVPSGARGFRVIDRLPFNERIIRAELNRRGCGVLEILARGVDIDPDAMRKRFKLRGTAPFALVVTRIGSAAVAFLCEAGIRGNPKGA